MSTPYTLGFVQKIVLSHRRIERAALVAVRRDNDFARCPLVIPGSGRRLRLNIREWAHPPDGGSQSSKRSGTARLHGSGTPAIPSVDLAALALPVAAAAAIFRFNIGQARRPDGFMHLRHPTPCGEHDLTRRGGFEPGLGDKEE